jgi:cytochrome c oxidase subunit 2
LPQQIGPVVARAGDGVGLPRVAEAGKPGIAAGVGRCRLDRAIATGAASRSIGGLGRIRGDWRMARSKRLPTTGGRMRVLATPLLVLPGAVAAAAAAVAAEPLPWQIGFQPPATPVQARVESFNNELTVIIGLITVFVLGLLLYVIVLFDARRHPVPTRTEHNTVIEILWSVIPVLILVIIAIPSFKLMYFMDRVPSPDMTIKVVGHQWYWSYQYPDQGGLAFDSNLVQTANLRPGQPRLLTADHPLVVPVDTNIRVLVASTDVIHSWFMPSFGVQEYAMPGRDNESWFRIGRQGTYRGQCNQICGVNHAFMPIEVKAVSKDEFQHWLVTAKKQFTDAGGTGSVRVAAADGSQGGDGSAPPETEIKGSR